MPAVETSRWNGGNEKLGTIRIFSSVSHTQNTRSVVTNVELLVLKFGSVDTLSTGAVGFGEITTLTHEPRDDPVENRIFVVQRLSRNTLSFFSGAQRPEVLNCFGNVVAEESNYDSSGVRSIDLDIKENLIGYIGLGGADFR